MIYVLLGEGYEEIEAVAPVDILRRAGLNVQYAGIGGKTITGAHGIKIESDITVDEIDLDAMEMIVVPGGGGVAAVEADESAMRALLYAFSNDIFTGLICAAPTILGKRGLLDGRVATCYPGMENDMGEAIMRPDESAVRDGKLITGRAPAAAVDFGLALVEALTDSSMKKTIMYFMAYNSNERNN